MPTRRTRNRRDTAPGRAASPIGVHEMRACITIPVEVRCCAVVAIATARGDWRDDGVALGRVTDAVLARAALLLRDVAGDPEVIVRLGLRVWEDVVTASEVVQGEQLRRAPRVDTARPFL